MGDVVFYRKYRPSKFGEVLGQEHITDVLKSAISSGQLAHAYLFSGPRGTGKTSVARILARELKISENDLYEIDGASNRGIDEIRELREAVKTLPFDSDKKAITQYQVLDIRKEFSIVKVIPVTGRSNQIRIHFKEMIG